MPTTTPSILTFFVGWEESLLKEKKPEVWHKDKELQKFTETKSSPQGSTLSAAPLPQSPGITRDFEKTSRSGFCPEVLVESVRVPC